MLRENKSYSVSTLAEFTQIVADDNYPPALSVLLNRMESKKSNGQEPVHKRQRDDSKYLLGDDVYEMAARALMSPNLSREVCFSFFTRTITRRQMKTVMLALSHGICKSNVTLQFHGCGITIKHIKLLRRALTTGNCPANLSIDLSSTNLDDAAAEHLAKAIASKRCPAQLELILNNNLITTAGVRLLVDSMIAAKGKSNVCISIADNNIGDEGAAAIADGINQGVWNFAENFFKLDGCLIGDQGFSVILSAILHRVTPAPLNCSFTKNHIGDTGVINMTRLLLAKPRQNLTIDITENLFGAAALQNIQMSYKLGRFPQTLEIAAATFVQRDWISRLNSAYIKNTMRMNVVLNCLAFLQGTRQDNHIMRALCPDVLLVILAEIYPFTGNLPDGTPEKNYFAKRTYCFFRHLDKNYHPLPDQSSACILAKK